MQVTLIRTKEVPQVTLKNNGLEEAKKYYLESSQNTFSIHKFMELSGLKYEEACAEILRIKKSFDSKNNERSWPSSYKCNFLEPGIVSYEDVGQGVALLKKESMDNWMQSFKGKPVIIDHQDVSPQNFKESAVGYITSVYYNDKTGWYDCEFIITNDEGHEAIKNGYSVSCSFDVSETIGGGEWHACKYNEEITKGEGLHLALVTSPRYEDCRIVVNSKKATVENKQEVTLDKKQNETDLTVMSTRQLDQYMGGLSDVGLQALLGGEQDESIKKLAKLHMGDREKKKEEEALGAGGGGGNKPADKKNETVVRKKEDAKMWKLFGRKEAVKDNKIDATKVYVDVDGERVPLSTLMNSYDGVEVLQETDMVKIEGKDVPIGELVASYRNSKTNGFPPKEEEDPKEKKEDAKECSKCGKVHEGACNKKNEEEVPEKEVKKDSKENAKDYFVDLQNARHEQKVDGKAERGMGDTREDKAARGKKFFGSKKK
jgi:hypothetical protein